MDDGKARMGKLMEQQDKPTMLIRRWVGCWIDLLVATALFFVPAIIAGIVGEDAGFAIAGALAFLIIPGYFVVAELVWGRTLGKLITGTVVVGIDGRKAGLGRVLVRTLLRLVEVNPFLLGGLPAGVAVLASPRMQRLGDMAAGTYVLPAKDCERFRRRLAEEVFD